MSFVGEFRVLACLLALFAMAAIADVSSAAQAGQAASSKGPARFGVGRPATAEEIERWDLDVGPDGAGLPPGRGTAREGEQVYASKCAACHGRTGQEGPADVLVGRDAGDGFSFGRNPKLTKTIGNYWPYPTTVFDYVRRAMPPDSPGSLSDDDVYRVVAYLLAMNRVIERDTVVDSTSLPTIVMPARDRFVVDPRGGPASVRRKAR